MRLASPYLCQVGVQFELQQLPQKTSILAKTTCIGKNLNSTITGDNYFEMSGIFLCFCD